jgi:hypothetical protein
MKGKTVTRTRRSASVAFAAFLLVLSTTVMASPASAASPTNDTQSGAVQVTAALPFVQTQDTTEATVDPTENDVRDACLDRGAPAFENSVWFVSQVPEGFSDSISIDTTGSDYSTGVAVLADFGEGPFVVDCVPGRFVSPGPPPAGTYYIVVFGDGFLTAETGGNLNLVIDTAAAPPEVSLTIDPTGRATKDGGVWVSGTVQCSGGGDGAEVLFLSGEISQRVGRVIASGFFDVSTSVPCDGVARPWSGYASPINATFSGGKATAISVAFACGEQCNSGYAEREIKLSRSGRGAN